MLEDQLAQELGITDTSQPVSFDQTTIDLGNQFITSFSGGDAEAFQEEFQAFSDNNSLDRVQSFNVWLYGLSVVTSTPSLSVVNSHLSSIGLETTLIQLSQEREQNGSYTLGTVTGLFSSLIGTTSVITSASYAVGAISSATLFGVSAATLGATSLILGGVGLLFSAFVPGLNINDVIFDYYNINNELDNGEGVKLSNAGLQYILASRVDSTINTEDVNKIVNAFSQQDKQGIESFVNSLDKLLRNISTTSAILDNDAYFNKVVNLLTDELQSTIAPITFIDTSPESLFALAKQDATLGASVRYALEELNPFYIDANLAAYQDASLNIGNFSDQYLRYRSKLLLVNIATNMKNFQSYESEYTDAIFVDHTQGIDINNTDPASTVTLSNEKLIIFGSENDEGDLRGRNGDDRVYGAGGNDYITGGEGQDYIEGGDGDDIILGGADNDQAENNHPGGLVGGKGFDVIFGGAGNDALYNGTIDSTGVHVDDADADTLYGGSGSDTYFAGDGDIIADDVDGAGVISFNGNVLGVATYVSENLYTDTNGNSFSFIGNSLIVTNGSNVLTIQGFIKRELGYLGITFEGEPVAGEDSTINAEIPPVTPNTGLISQAIGWGGETTPDFEDTYYSETFIGQNEKDSIHAGGGDDIVLGNGGDDFIDGNWGHDQLFGGNGNDIIIGDSEDFYYGSISYGAWEFIDGSPKNGYRVLDYIDSLGEFKNAIIYRGAFAKDVNLPERGEANFEGNDYIDGGAGDDLIAGRYGNDFLIGGLGNDAIGGARGDDVIDGGDGDDYIIADYLKFYEFEFPDVYGQVATSFDDPLNYGNNTVYGGNGEDEIYGGAKSDFISGGDNNDLIRSGFDEVSFDNEEDVVFGDAGDDIIFAGGGNDKLYGGNGKDEIDGRSGNDLVSGGDGIDLLVGGDGDDELFGDKNSDTLYGGDGNDELFGGAGNDFLFAHSDQTETPQADYGNDLFDGGAGDDRVQGGLGDDEHIESTGRDIIIDAGGNDLYRIQSRNLFGRIIDENGTDTVKFENGATLNSIRTNLAGNDLNIIFDNSNLITLVDWKISPFIESFEFSDGTIIPGSQILNANEIDEVISDTSSSSVITGTNKDDLISTTGINNTLEGGAGNDIYILSTSSGSNTINDNEGNNSIVFDAGITAADITGSYVGSDLQISDGTNSFLLNQATYEKITGYYFSDGSVLTNEEILPDVTPPEILVEVDDKVVVADQNIAIQLPSNIFFDELSGAVTVTAYIDDVELVGANQYNLVYDSSANAITGNPSTSSIGQYAIELRGEDASGNTASQSFNLDIVESAIVNNDAVEGANNILVGQQFAFTIPLPTRVYEIEENTSGGNDFAVGRSLIISIGHTFHQFYSLFPGEVTSISDLQSDNTGLNINNLSNFPDWISFDASTLTFSGTPQSDDVGHFEFHFDYVDGNFELDDIIRGVQYTFHVRENINAPTITAELGSVAFVDEQANSALIPLDTFIDPEGGTITYNVTQSDGSALPSWLSFDSSTGLLSGTPPNISPTGSHLLTLGGANIQPNLILSVTGTDAQGNTSSTPLYLWVGDTVGGTPADDPSVSIINIDDDDTSDYVEAIQPTTIVTGGGHTVVSNTAGNNIVINFDEANRDSNFVYLNAEGEVTINSASNSTNTTRRYNNQTIYGSSGNDSYILNVSPLDTTNVYINDLATATGANKITFGAPGSSLTRTRSNSIISLGSLKISFGDGLEVHLNNFDPNDVLGSRAVDVFEFSDGEIITYEEFISQGFDIDGTNQDDVLTGTNVIDRIQGLVGNDSIDAGEGNDVLSGGQGDDAYIIEQGDGHDVIIERLGSDTIQLGAGILQADISGMQSGNDLQLTLGTDQTLTIQDWFLSDDHQVESLVFDDGAILSRIEIQSLVPELANSAPVLDAAITDQIINQGDQFNFQIPTTTFSDANDVFELSVLLNDGLSLPNWLTFDELTNTFTGTPANDDVGSISVVVTATDTFGEKISDEFMITVNNVNDAPIVNNAISLITAQEDSAFSYTLEGHVFVDIDGDTFTLSAGADGGMLPAWLSFDVATQTFSGTPSNSDVGVYQIELTATDSNQADTIHAFALEVQDTNDLHVLSNPIQSQSVAEGNSFNLVISDDVFTDIDQQSISVNSVINFGALSYTLLSQNNNALPSWLSYDSITNTLSGTPTSADVGTYSLEYIATDIEGNDVVNAFTLTVNSNSNSNNAPTLDNAIADQVAIESSVFSFIVPSNAFSDPDTGDTLTYSALLTGGASLPAWLSFDALTKTFSGTPGIGDLGSVDIDVTVTDSGGLSVTDIFVLTVNPAINYIDLVGTGGYDYLAAPTDESYHIQGLGDYDVLHGFDHADWLEGGAGSDDLFAYDGDNLLDGGTGNDSLHAGIDNDVYLFNLGDGLDRIIDSGGMDTIKFSAGIISSDLEVVQAGDHLAIKYSDTDAILIENWNTGGQGQIENLLFTENGEQLNASQTEALAGSYLTYTGTSNYDYIAPQINAPLHISGLGDYDVLHGFDHADLLEGGAGSDDLFAYAGNDIVNGGEGDDAVYSHEGDDILTGGVGQDSLYGGKGSDTYTFNAGDGFDEIYETNNPNTGDVDKIEYGAGVGEGDLWFVQSNNHLDIYTLGSTGDKVRSITWYSQPNKRIEEIHAGGMVLQENDVQQLVNAMAAFGAPVNGEVNLTQGQQDQIDSVIASVWSVA